MSARALSAAARRSAHGEGGDATTSPLRIQSPNSPEVMWPEPSASSATHTALSSASGSSAGERRSSLRTIA